MIILHTERLTLRWFTADDAAFVRALLNEPSWIQNIGDRGVRTLPEAAAWIEGRLMGGYRDQGVGFWAVVRKEDGVVMGMAGLVSRDSLPDPDVGYALLPAYWGHGYAVEAAAACMEYGRRVLGLRRIMAIMTPGNTRSEKVLHAIGLRFLETRVLPGEEEDTAVFAWEDTKPPMDDRAEIDGLATRFFALFTNRDGAVPSVAAIPYFFLRRAVVTRATAQGISLDDVAGFMTPRAELLSSGRLVGFSEHEIEARTEVSGRIAQRWSRYRKSGTLDGAAFEGEGTKTMQLVKTGRGWKIAALAWEDTPG